MKTKTKLLLSLVAVVTIVVDFVLLFSTVCNNRHEVLATMNKDMEVEQTANSEVSFSGAKGDRIKFSLKTTVQSGTVDFILTDSKGNVVADFDRAKELEKYVDLNYDDTYTLTAIYEKFTGKFSIKVSKKKA